MNVTLGKFHLWSSWKFLIRDILGAFWQIHLAIDVDTFTIFQLTWGKYCGRTIIAVPIFMIDQQRYPKTTWKMYPIIRWLFNSFQKNEEVKS